MWGTGIALARIQMPSNDLMIIQISRGPKSAIAVRRHKAEKIPRNFKRVRDALVLFNRNTT